MISGRLRDWKTPETRINTTFLRVLGVSFIACVGGAFAVNGAQMVPKSHAGLASDFAGVAGITLHGVNAASVCADYDTYMVCAAV